MNLQKSTFSLYALTVSTCFLLCIFLSTSYGDDIPQFTIMTETWVPYNFEQDGVLQGISVDMLLLMLERIGSTQGRQDIKIYPWMRAYTKLQQEPNTMLFTTIRTEERESMFKWVGPIFETKMNIYALKKNKILIRSFEDLRKYQIGTLRGDVTEDLLINKAGLNRNGFHQVSSNVQNTKKLMSGRIDLLAHSQETMVSTCQEAEFDTDEFETVFVLDSTRAYYAFHHDTPDEVITTFQKAFDDIKNEGKLSGLFYRYGK